MERNLPGCPFRFERNPDGTPVFEDFAKRNVKVGDYYLYGTCDGILEYVTQDGELIRVGLEVKSKQTTSARTSLHSMREPEEKHVKQCVAYSKMYEVDHYVILYVNASKKAWVYAEGDYAKNPDIRAFGVTITEDARTELFARLAEINDAIKSEVPPPLDLENWTFNNFKTACALSVTDEEVDELNRKVSRMKRSSLPEFKKRQYVEALEFIEKVREGEAK
ncbi:hypothetical protein [Alkalihalobacillus pseudalcaliphilus]|uniref:hypothetical protein n=1 Tax=Alkalihalobacillus pseudalcaliphilus TaxID=79884 RepID=UPI0030811707